MTSKQKKTINLIKKNGEFVNYDGSVKKLKKNNIRNAGYATYVISECNDKNKYSKRYWNCTGTIIVGEDKNTGEQISFMSHQDPWKFLSGKKEEFTRDMIELIKTAKAKTKEGSIDAIIFGGKNGDLEYINSIELISKIFTEELHFEPTVMTGPSLNLEDPTEAYFDTQNRRLYLVRPAQKSELNQNYLPSELGEKSKKW